MGAYIHTYIHTFLSILNIKLDCRILPYSGLTVTLCLRYSIVKVWGSHSSPRIFKFSATIQM